MAGVGKINKFYILISDCHELINPPPPINQGFTELVLADILRSYHLYGLKFIDTSEKYSIAMMRA